MEFAAIDQISVVTGLDDLDTLDDAFWMSRRAACCPSKTHQNNDFFVSFSTLLRFSSLQAAPTHLLIPCQQKVQDLMSQRSTRCFVKVRGMACSALRLFTSLGTTIMKREPTVFHFFQKDCLSQSRLPCLRQRVPPTRSANISELCKIAIRPSSRYQSYQRHDELMTTALLSIIYLPQIIEHLHNVTT